MFEEKKRYKIIKENNKSVKIHFFDSNEIIEYRKITNDDIKLMLEKNQDINLEGCYIKDFSYAYICGVDNSSCDLNKSLSKRKKLKNFNAHQAFFDGNTSFSWAQFGDGDVDFSEAQFGDGDVFFSWAEFGKGKVDFFKVDFGDGDVDFTLAQFGDGDVFFSKAKFGDGNVDFSEAIFGEGDVYFPMVEFGKGNVDFYWAQFGDGFVDFYRAQFGEGNVYFSRAIFGDGNVNFFQVKLGKGGVFFSGASFGDGVFVFDSITNIEQLHFEIKSAKDTIFFFNDCHFSSPVFINVNPIKYLLLNNCTISNLLSFDLSPNDDTKDKQIALFKITNMGTIKLDWEMAKYSIINFNPKTIPIKETNKSDTLIDLLLSCSDKKELNKLKCEELSLIKENYHNQGRYDWEDEAYVEFKKRATIFDKKKLSINPFKSLYYLISFLIYKVMYPVGKFGTDPISILGTMIITVLLFGGIFYFPFVDIHPPKAPFYWWSPIYYSAITFFTIGYGDLSAQNGWAALFCGLEGFLGVFFMGYFSVALVRKILR